MAMHLENIGILSEPISVRCEYGLIEFMSVEPASRHEMCRKISKCYLYMLYNDSSGCLSMISMV